MAWVKWLWSMLKYRFRKVIPKKVLVSGVDRKCFLITSSGCDVGIRFDVVTVFYNGCPVGVPYIDVIEYPGDITPCIQVWNPEICSVHDVTGVHSGRFTVGESCCNKPKEKHEDTE